MRQYLLAALFTFVAGPSAAAEKDPPKPMPAEEVARKMHLPPGFKVTVFAAEPDVVQPMAMTFDDRGRLWVVECLSYPDWIAPGGKIVRNGKLEVPKDPNRAKGRDRITIFEDTDGDGKHDKRTVFYDKGVNFTGIEYGFGGVFVTAPPYLLFIPDKNRDDKPDGPPQILLDGWDLKAKHNAVNCLKWGPDGWLYGCNGILSNSEVRVVTSKASRERKPEVRGQKSEVRGRKSEDGGRKSEDGGRKSEVGKTRPLTTHHSPITNPTHHSPLTKLNCGVWRYHPTRRVFEVVAHGTTNPWGLDFNADGEMFITNCVIKHVFHVVPGGHYERMFGQDVTPHVYGLMPSCADHIHWGGGKWTDSRGGAGVHDKPGGGHAHAGCMIYLGDNWPAKYRGKLFTCNIHGRRVNMDVLQRHGSGYVASHGDDFLKVPDPWFRGLELKYGPDGGVYLTDWSDIGECHDYNDIHRENGRIYKITYGDVKPWRGDLVKLSPKQLHEATRHENHWFVRHALRLWYEQLPSPTRNDHDIRQRATPNVPTPKALNNKAQGRDWKERTLGTGREQRAYPEGVAQPRRPVERLQRSAVEARRQPSVRSRWSRRWALLSNLFEVKADRDGRTQFDVRSLADVWMLQPAVMDTIGFHAGAPEARRRALGIQLTLDYVDVLKKDTNEWKQMVNRMQSLAVSDKSSRVRLALASGLQRLPVKDRWGIAEALVAHAEDAKDANIPLMIWYGIEPAVTADRTRAIALLKKTKIPLLRQYIVRRLAETAK